MGRDRGASRERLIEAATAEFAEHGIAGARVDRMAASSGVNKGQMYGWYGSKEGLFEAVFERHLQRIVDVVPFDPFDLPGYVTALHDSYLADPELVRLASWYRLERVPRGALLQAYPGLSDDKHEAVARAQEQGAIVADLAPEDVYALLISIAGTWGPISATDTAAAGDADELHERHRAALRAVVSRALVPAPPA